MARFSPYLRLTRLTWLVLASYMLLISSSLALAKTKVAITKSLPEARHLVTLGVIDGESDDKMSVATIRFDKEPSWKSPALLEDHGSFLQLVLPDTIVPSPGQFYEGRSPYIKKMAVFQLTANEAAVRFFVSAEAAKVKDAAQVELFGKRVVVTVDHTRLKEFLATQSKNSANLVTDTLRNATMTAEDVIAKTQVRHDIPQPAMLIRNDAAAAVGLAATPANDQTKGFDLRDKLIQVSLFSGGMLLLLAFTWMAKPYMRRRAAKAGQEPLLAMKTLASLALSPKQKLSLIQIGDERILIAVSPDNVTFITTINRNQTSSQVFSHALTGGPIAQAQFPVPAAATMPSFEKLLSQTSQETVELRPSFRLKNPDAMTMPSAETKRDQPAPRPTNKPVPRRKVTTDAASRPAVSSALSSRINIAIDEDGIRNLSQKPKPTLPTPAAAAPEGQQAIDDVTRLIREKLKTLRTI